MHAQEIKRDTTLYSNSIGLGLGIYSHLSYKAFIFEDVAIDVTIGRFETKRDGIYISLGLQHHKKASKQPLHTYFGGGFIFEYSGDFDNIGVKFPLGFEAVGKNKRISYFGEATPIIFYQYENNFFFPTADRQITPSIMVNLGVRLIFIK